MGLIDIIQKNRSYRRFQNGYLIDFEILRELVDLTRYAASAQNLQPLKYILSFEAEKNEKIFPCLAWAGYLSDWSGPKKEEQPSAYIIILGDTVISKKFDIDSGIAVQTMLLGAVEKGLGGCIIGSIRREKLRQSLDIPEQYEILLTLALGKPAEKIVIEDVSIDNIKYWRDEKTIHHVPKRALDDIILNI